MGFLHPVGVLLVAWGGFAPQVFLPAPRGVTHRAQDDDRRPRPARRQDCARARGLQRPARQKNRRGQERPPHPRGAADGAQAARRRRGGGLRQPPRPPREGRRGRPETADDGPGRRPLRRIARQACQKSRGRSRRPRGRGGRQSTQIRRRDAARKRALRPARAEERRAVRRPTRRAGRRVRQRRLRHLPQRPRRQHGRGARQNEDRTASRARWACSSPRNSKSSTG